MFRYLQSCKTEKKLLTALLIHITVQNKIIISSQKYLFLDYQGDQCCFSQG